jgi:hypothetical protein
MEWTRARAGGILRAMENYRGQSFEEMDRRVLSVPAGPMYAIMTEHNVYACPDHFPAHDLSVVAFAPRDESGNIPRLFCIGPRIVTNPAKPLFPDFLSLDYRQSILAFISVTNRRCEQVGRHGNFRFYVLGDLADGALKHRPFVNCSTDAHVYLSLRELLSGAPVVRALK